MPAKSLVMLQSFGADSEPTTFNLRVLSHTKIINAELLILNDEL
jgi:hypothetical protein